MNRTTAFNFAVTVRNVDADDPRCGTETELTFGGVVLDADIGDEKECAILHTFPALSHPSTVAQFGRVIPLFRTFRLIRSYPLSDAGLR